MRKDFRFGGSGGQGVISLAVLLANAYGVQNNYEVAQTQSYGPAARGGACKAELVVSDERIDYVKADKLDSFVAFNKPSFDKFKGDINPDTRLFVDSTFVTAEDVSGTPAKQVFLFPATKYAEENFRVVCTNIVMMGYIVAHNPDISLENAQNAIRAVMNPKVVDLNLKALQFGYEHGKADLARSAGRQRIQLSGGTHGKSTGTLEKQNHVRGPGGAIYPDRHDHWRERLYQRRLSEGRSRGTGALRPRA